jgi:alpha-L-arabinofuranosidase
MASWTMRAGMAALACALASSPGWAQPAPTSLTVHADLAGPTINRDIFGQFAEHLGQGIYGGVWVGKASAIPNVRGVRSDVVQALKAIKVPVVRWPGGCFAEEYHWRRGVGPADKRVSTVNANWGDSVEPNSFGTDEFMDFAEQIGAEAYITVNVGSGTPGEAAEWLEYMTASPTSTLGAERAANGHKAPYRVKYLGIGNESWGCGGTMSPENYVEHLKAYSRFVRNMNPAQNGAGASGSGAMQRVAVGPDAGKPDYTEAVMKAWKDHGWSWGVEGLSLHAYTTGGWPPAYPSTGFGEKDYATLVKEALGMEAMVADTSAIMDRYDPKKQVGLVVDEWGAWLAPTPGTNPGFLMQQNSLRDAIIAALDLNIFARHADRVRMTNIAQMVNVLQAMVLTDGPKMVLTPTYYVYKLYAPFQDAELIPATFDAGVYSANGLTMPRVDAIAARDRQGRLWLAVTNLDPDRPADILAAVDGASARGAKGEVLTAARVDAVNTFDKPDAVKPEPVSIAAVDGRLPLHLPPKSITVVSLEP